MMHQPYFPSSYSQSTYPMNPFQNQAQMPQNLQNTTQNPNQEIPNNFRSEYQGVLHGLNCWVNLMYAGLGMVSYGKTFFDMSISVVRTVSRVVVKVMFKLFGFQFLGRFLNWLSALRGNGEHYHELWSGMMPGQADTHSNLGKILLVLRILLLLGMGASYFIKRKLEKQALEKRKALENYENTLKAQEICANLHFQPEVSENLNETKATEESKNSQLEEKLESALEEEVNKNKELFMKLRSEDFWNNNKAPSIFQQQPESVSLTTQDPKEENLVTINIPEKISGESVQDPYRIFMESQIKEPVVELKKEKITAPVGAKPWATKKKTN